MGAHFKALDKGIAVAVLFATSKLAVSHRRAPGGGRGVKPTLFGKIRDPPLKKKRDPTLEKPRGPPPKKTSYFGPQAQIFFGGLIARIYPFGL